MAAQGEAAADGSHALPRPRPTAATDPDVERYVRDEETDARASSGGAAGKCTTTTTATVKGSTGDPSSMLPRSRLPSLIGMDDSNKDMMSLSKCKSIPKVHHSICTELTTMLEKISSILPSIEAAQIGCKAGIQELCNLRNVVEKGKFIILHCIECSKLYLAITGEAIVARCERIRDSLRRSLFLIKNMVPRELSNLIAEVHNNLQVVKFILDPKEEEAGKTMLQFLRQSDINEGQELEAYLLAASNLNLMSPKSISIERRAIKKLLDKIRGTDPKKEGVLKFFLYLIKKYGMSIRAESGEQNENMQTESWSLTPSTTSIDATTTVKGCTPTGFRKYEDSNITAKWPMAEWLLETQFVTRPQPHDSLPCSPHWSESEQYHSSSSTAGSSGYETDDYLFELSFGLGVPKVDPSVLIDGAQAMGDGEGRLTELPSGSLQHLQNMYYKIILAMLGIGRSHKRARSWCSSETKSTSSVGFISSVDLQDLSVTHPTEGVIHGSREQLIAMIQKCKLLVLGINVFGKATIIEDTDDSQELPVFAFDDLYYASQAKKTRVQRIPAHVVDPLFLLPTAVKNLLYLDLSGCTGLAQVPASIGFLLNLASLNLSCCYSLHTLSGALGSLQNLQILVLSCCHKLRNLPLSICNLPILRLLDLSGCFSLEVLPDSFINLGCLEILNLSECKGLKEFPPPFGRLQELRYLNLSGCSGMDLDVEYLRKLANLKFLTLSPHTNIQGFPDSFHDLENRLGLLRWWKNNRVHPQCNPKATSLHPYRSCERSIVDRLLSVGPVEGDATGDLVVNFICIVGASGMGKTELVHRIYNDQMILDTFNLRIWVPQLTTYDKNSLLIKIVELTTCTYCSNAPMRILEDTVIEELTGKRLLLVLDNADVQNLSFWSDVQRLLNVCAKGSTLIMTAKNREVANKVRPLQICYLNSLSKEECFMIFKEHVIGGLDINDYPQLESVGLKVVEKCSGNALCIKALTGLLCHSDIGLSEIDMLDDGVLPALRLCYDLLPAHLQQCFKFCSLFPKGYTFSKHHIVRLWIAQSFVLPKEGSVPEDTALQYFDELVCRSFFQHSPVCNDQEDMFIMHELFHDLSDSVSKDEFLRLEEPFCSLPGNIAHLSVVLSDFKTVALNKESRNLLSLLVVRRSFPVAKILHSNDLYEKYECLRALNLSYTDILELPSSIGNMRHLRFLALNNTKIKGLPFEIGQLGALQTLELKDCCQLTELPRNIVNLLKLRHLDVQKEPGDIKVGMPQGIGRLTDLQTLTVFNIGTNPWHCSIRELANLSGLRGHVHISGLENIKTSDDAREANMTGKLFIEALTLEWCCSYSNESIDDDLGKEIANDILQNLQPNSNLRDLFIRNYTGSLFPVWMQKSYLTNLVSITLDNCNECFELPYFGDLPSLKYLFIQKMNAVANFVVDRYSSAKERKHSPRFPSLEVLTLWDMYDLQFWVGTSEGDFPQLRRLCISRCPKLTKLPTLISLVHLSLHFGGQVPSFSELPSLDSLKIEGFYKIKSISFPHHVMTLRKLEIIDCKELLSLYACFLSVSDFQVIRCLKLDLVGSSQEDHLGQQIVDSRSKPARSSMVLKRTTSKGVNDDGWKWNIYCKKNILGSRVPRSYYRCINRSSTGCNAIKFLQHDDTDPNMLSVMYISEHNHESTIELHLELSAQQQNS